MLLLVYGGALVWILPPLEDLRWTDEVQAAPVAAAEAAPDEGGEPAGKGAAAGRKPGRNRRSGAASPKATLTAAEGDQADRQSPGKPGKPAAGPRKGRAKNRAAGGAGEAAVAKREEAAGSQANQGAGTDQDGKARGGKRAKAKDAEARGDGAQGPAGADPEGPLVAELELHLDPQVIVPDGASFRVELLGGAKAQRALATWLRQLGGPPLESDAFGSSGVPATSGAPVQLRVPTGWPLRVLCEAGELSEIQRLAGLESEALQPLTFDLVPEDSVAEAQGAGRPSGSDASAPLGEPGAEAVHGTPAVEPGATDPLAEGGDPGPEAAGGFEAGVIEAAAHATSKGSASDGSKAIPTGRLGVEVVDALGSGPVAGAVLRLTPISKDPSLLARLRDWAEGPDADPILRSLLAPSGAPVEAAGSLGTALPAGIAFRLEGDVEPGPSRRTEIELEPLAAGEDRLLQLELMPPAESGDDPGDAAGRGGADTLAQDSTVADSSAPASDASVTAHPGDEPRGEAGDPSGAGERDPGRGEDGADQPRLRGLVLDQDGNGVSGLSIWMVIPWGAADRNPRRFRFEDRVRAEVLTEADGSFAFPEAPDGRWLVGVAPAGTARVPDPEAELSRVAEAVHLKRGKGADPVILRVGRGLRLAGKIEDSSGDPAAFLSISAVEEGVVGSLWTRTAADGTFDVGPLGPRSCSLVVRVSDRGEQTFGPFEAGADDVFVSLRASARVDGMVFDSVGQRTGACRVQVLRPYAEPPEVVSTLDVTDGQFSAPDLELGVYRLVATADGQRIAVSNDVDLRAKDTASGLELVLVDGAVLEIQLRGEREARTVSVARGTRTYAVALVQPGETWRPIVPAGALSISMLSAEGVVLDQRRLSAVRGETHELIFDR